MLCEKCQANEATVHRTSIENGRRRRQSLCEFCASPDLNVLLRRPKAIRPQDVRGTISIPDPVLVQDLAKGLGVHGYDLVGRLIAMEIFLTQTASIDFETALRLCAQFGVTAVRRNG